MINIDIFFNNSYETQSGQKDYNNGRIQLADALKEASINIHDAKHKIVTVWKISKPYMDL